MYVSEEQSKSPDHDNSSKDTVVRPATCLENSAPSRELEPPNAQPASQEERRREVRKPTDEPASIQLLSPLEPARFNVRVLDISRAGLKIRTQRFLSRGVVLQIHLRDMMILGEVRYCVVADNAFYAGLCIQDCVERRKDRRLRVDIPATIFDAPAVLKPQKEFPARIVDQSGTGMLITAHCKFVPGNAVRIVAGGKLFLAEVAHCTAAGHVFRIGVRVDQVLTL